MEGPQLTWAGLIGAVFAPGRSPRLPSLAKAGRGGVGKAEGNEAGQSGTVLPKPSFLLSSPV